MKYVVIAILLLIFGYYTASVQEFHNKYEYPVKCLLTPQELNTPDGQFSRLNCKNIWILRNGNTRSNIFWSEFNRNLKTDSAGTTFGKAIGGLIVSPVFWIMYIFH